MSYAKRLLVEGEEIRYSARLHPIIYLPGCLVILLALFIATVTPEDWRHWPALEEYFKAFSWHPYLFQVVCLILFTIGALMVLNSLAIVLSTELAVTNRRVIAKYGLTNIITIEIDRYKIISVIINQSFTGQLLNYGQIRLQGIAGDIAGLPNISRPYELQKEINQSVL